MILQDSYGALKMPQMEEYQGIFDRNANEVQDLLFVQRITNQIQQQMSKKKWKKNSLLPTHLKHTLDTC